MLMALIANSHSFKHKQSSKTKVLCTFSPMPYFALCPRSSIIAYIFFLLFFFTFKQLLSLKLQETSRKAKRTLPKYHIHCTVVSHGNSHSSCLLVSRTSSFILSPILLLTIFNLKQFVRPYHRIEGVDRQFKVILPFLMKSAYPLRLRSERSQYRNDFSF